MPYAAPAQPDQGARQRLRVLTRRYELMLHELHAIRLSEAI
jgi:hypothetical protein